MNIEQQEALLQIEWVHSIENKPACEEYDRVIVTRRQFVDLDHLSQVENLGVTVQSIDSFGANGNLRLGVRLNSRVDVPA